MRFSLTRVYINAGGYDRTGQYWGLGAPLYWYTSADEKVSDHLRAYSRQDAIEKVLKRYPNAIIKRGVGV